MGLFSKKIMPTSPRKARKGFQKFVKRARDFADELESPRKQRSGAMKKATNNLFPEQAEALNSVREADIEFTRTANREVAEMENAKRNDFVSSLNIRDL